MKIESIDRSDSSWEYRITLDSSEWPMSGHSDEWDLSLGHGKLLAGELCLLPPAAESQGARAL